MTAIALVTGGNRGIGKAACRQLAQKNTRVLLTGRDLDKAKDGAASAAMSSRRLGERCGF